MESEHAINWKAWWQVKGQEAGSLHTSPEHEAERANWKWREIFHLKA